ncbi:MAG TPA: hypothetical protein VK658_27140 [Chryseolinea sp.]|nr:hypothetical protein [Chryseolinea sp.]
MKKTLLILGGIGLLGMLLVARLFFSQSNSMGEEREWFVKGLRYEFSARVDSVRMFNENTGRIWCRLTSGNPQIDREDSLKRLFKHHDMLYLIFHRSGDSIIFLIPNGKHVRMGDSVRISSERNSIQFCRGGMEVATDQLSNTLTGFSRPFFLKGKQR